MKSKIYPILLVFWIIFIRAFVIFGDTKTIAIMYFADKSIKQELGFLEKAFTQMLITDLSNIEGLNIVERERVEKFLEEIALSDLGVIDEKTCQKAGEAIGADYLVMGKIEGGISEFTVSAEIQEVKTQKVTSLEKITGNISQTLEVEKKLIAIIGEALGIDISTKKEIKLPVQKKAQITLVVMRFQNNSFDNKLDPLQEGFADLITGDLAHVTQLKIIEREFIYKVLKELELTLSGLTDKANCIKVGQMLGAEIMLMGNFIETGGSLRLDSHLIDGDKGLLLRADSVTGSTKEFYELEKELVSTIVSNLAIILNEKEKEQISQVSTKSVESFIYYSQGCESYRGADFANAAGWYNKALYIDPDFRNARERLAMLYLCELNDPEKAAPHYEKLIHIMSGEGFWQWFYPLGHVYSKLGKRDNAIKIFKKIVDEAPSTNWHLQYLRAWSAHSIGAIYYDNAKGEEDYKCAAEWFEKAIDLFDPQRDNDPIRSARRYLADIYEKKLHRPGMAVKQYEKLLEQSLTGLNSDDAQFDIADTYYKRGEYKKALESFTKLVNTFPDDELYDRTPEAQYKIGQIYQERLMEYNNAVAAYQKLIKNYPASFECSSAQYQIGVIYENYLKDIDKAIGAYKKCVINYSIYDFNGKRAYDKLQTMKIVLNNILDDRSKILLDEKHGQFSSFNSQGLGHYSLVKTLRKNNFIVHENKSSEITVELLKPYRILILNGGAHEKLLSDVEIEVIKQFVTNGGGVFVGVFRGGNLKSLRSDLLYNPLIYQFGCVVKDFSGLSKRDNYIELEKHPITADIERIWTSGAVAIETASVLPVIKCDNKNILCAGGYGRGKIVVSSLGMSFMNYGLGAANRIREVSVSAADVEDSSKIYENNKRLLLNIVNWLQGSQEGFQCFIENCT